MKKLILALLVSIFFSGAGLAQASLMLNEIMYDLPDSDEGKEWVEIFNSGPDSIDLSEYKFFEGDTNHKIISVHGSGKVEAQGYAILVSNPEKFKTSFPNFIGEIFDSSFTLSNTGETLALKDKDLKTVDEVSYSSSVGGAGNGRTISKIDGAWREGKVTIGEMNEIYVTPTKPKVALATVQPKAIVPQKIIPEKVIEVPVIEKNIQTASVAESIPTPPTKNKKSPVYLISMLGLVILGAGTVYLVRRKKNDEEEFEGDDFEIME